MADAADATPITEVKRLEAALQGGAELAVGSRARPRGSVARRTRLHRRIECTRGAVRARDTGAASPAGARAGTASSGPPRTLEARLESTDPSFSAGWVTVTSDLRALLR